jgi:hypothetical protein
MKLQKWCMISSLLLVAGFVVWLATGAALAANLNPSQRGTPGAGSCVWHFVNNQTGGATSGTLTTSFSGSSCIVISTTLSKVNQNVLQFLVITDGACTLTDASTNQPGNLLLSDLTCTTPTPTPSPTPTVTPVPTP